MSPLEVLFPTGSLTVTNDGETLRFAYDLTDAVIVVVYTEAQGARSTELRFALLQGKGSQERALPWPKKFSPTAALRLSVSIYHGGQLANAGVGIVRESLAEGAD